MRGLFKALLFVHFHTMFLVSTKAVYQNLHIVKTSCFPQREEGCPRLISKQEMMVTSQASSPCSA